MRAALLGCSLCLVALLAAAQDRGSLSINITQPQDSSVVHQRDFISGLVSDPGADVIVVIHPIETSGFWVQPPVTVESDGTWRVLVYFGREGKDADKLFEVRAYANPAQSLAEGEYDKWPVAKAQSRIVTVRRGKG
jgi:hypothetical protein